MLVFLLCVCVWCVCVCSFLSILVLVTIFEMGTIFMTRPPPSLTTALFFILCLCVFSIPVVGTIFVRSTIFMNCPPPSHSMWCFFVVCVHFFGSIIEFIGHLSFCKKRDFYDGDSEKKWSMLFLFLVGIQEQINIYFTKKKKKKRVVIGI